MSASSHRRSEIVSGLFVLGAITVFTLLVFRVGGIDVSRAWTRAGLPCRALFDDVKTLTVGAKVVVGGREVGAVTGIELAERVVEGQDSSLGVAVDFELTAADLRLDLASAGVEVVQDGFLGQHHLLLRPGRWGAAAAPATLADLRAGGGSRDDAGRVVLAGNSGGALDEVLASVQPVLERVDSLVTKLDENLLSDDNLERVGRAIQHVEGTLGNLRRSFDGQRADGLRKRLLDPLAEAIGLVRTTVEDVRRHLTERTLPKADEILDRTSSTLASAESTFDSTREAIAEVRPRVTELLDELTTTTKGLESHIVALRREAVGLLADTRGVVAENRPEVAESVRRLRRTLWQAELLVRKLRANPAFLLFGDDEVDYRLEPKDESMLLRSGRARPFGQRDEGR